MQSPDTTDAPLVPDVLTDAESTTETGPPIESTRTDGGPSERLDFDRPPRTDHAAAYTRDEEEIEPLVADLR